MSLSVEDLDDQEKFVQILSISYNDLLPFILKYLNKPSVLTVLFWSACLISFGFSFILIVNIAGDFQFSIILFHSLLGLIIFPILCIPLHEALHIIPYYISGAKKIRAGMDLSQYLFYVTAHRYVATPFQFRIVAATPFIIISITSLFLILKLPGLWKESLSLFLFVHTTMCAGDFAMLNFYFLNRNKKIYTWDDADRKIAYFYEKL